MLCGFPTVQQAAIVDCLSFDPFPFDQYGLTAAEVDVGWRQIADAFVIAQVIVVSGERLGLCCECTTSAHIRQIGRVEEGRISVSSYPFKERRSERIRGR